MAITAGMVKELRGLTGAGMMDCKKVLTEAEGSIEKAVELLREKGLAAAEKKAGRIAAEGLVKVIISDDNKAAAIVEVNSETDFVSKNEIFITYVNDVATQVMKSEAKSVDELMEESWINDETAKVKEVLINKISTIGEKLSIRRFEKLTSNEGFLVSYTHGGGRIGVLVEFKCEEVNDKLIEAGKNIAMQIAAVRPKYVSREEVSEEYLAKEKEILTQQALNEGKPAAIVEKMVVGRLNKELKEVCLLDQVYVKDGELTVSKYIDSVAKEVGSKLEVKKFVRFETGEGIEKREENFAEEVAKQMGV